MSEDNRCCSGTVSIDLRAENTKLKSSAAKNMVCKAALSHQELTAIHSYGLGQRVSDTSH